MGSGEELAQGLEDLVVRERTMKSSECATE